MYTNALSSGTQIIAPTHTGRTSNSKTAYDNTLQRLVSSPFVTVAYPPWLTPRVYGDDNFGV